ncbi:MAG TPA: 1,4-alpha-glucan branching protein domain-containing protein, partial [Candidatus Kapabacteria bacterium]
GSFTFILHTHLPYVLHHGKWPHGSDWLSEAVAECYLPILDTLERLSDEGIEPRISMDFSPINLEQLADPDFEGIFAAYCEEKITAAEKDYLYFKQNKEEHLIPMAEYWREFYSNAKTAFFDKYNGNVVTGFRKLAESGVLDAMTCGATHGYFPLLLRDDNIRGQIECATHTHEKHFGKRPRGIWLPECGYRPRYEWTSIVGPDSYRQTSEMRAGVEELVSEAGLEYFVVDGALTRGGMTVPAYQPLAKKLHEKFLEEFGQRGEPQPEADPNRSLTDIYWVGKKQNGSSYPVAIFSRDPQSSSRVWSAELGYPGAGVYLDFHKKHHNSGLRYWSVTGAGTDLGDKQPYVPYRTEWQLDWDADDFVSLVQKELEDHASAHGYPGMLAAPFDTELFGHWWAEGPRFLEKVMRRIAASEKVQLTDCAEALDTYSEPRTTIALPEGSWGEGGHHFVWANHEVAWMWDTIYPLEDRFLNIVHRFLGEGIDVTLRWILEQSARELLLLESSDWPFVISTQGAIEYSKKRFAEHAELLTGLLDMAERYEGTLTTADEKLLYASSIKDSPFREIDLHWWEKPEHPNRHPEPAPSGAGRRIALR